MVYHLLKTNLPTLLFLLCSLTSFGQVDEKLSRQVLDVGAIDSTFVFGEWTTEKNDGTEVHLTYLGEVVGLGACYRVMTSTTFWGASSRHATCRLLLFDEHNNLIGLYYLGGLHQLPEKATDEGIVWHYRKNSGCDPTMIQIITFEQGIPHEFFLRCEGEMGNLYTFDANK